MELCEMTVPDILFKCKHTDLNKELLQRFNGLVSIPENIGDVLKDIYQDTLMLNKDTITVFIKTCENPHCLEDSRVKDLNLTNEDIVGRLFTKLNLSDIIKVVDILCG